MFKVTVRTSASNVLPRWLNVQGTIIHCSTQDDWMLRIKSYSIATKIIQDAWIFTTRFSWVASGSSKNLIWLFLLSFSFLFCSCLCYCYCCFVLVFFFVLVFGILVVVVVVACCCCCCCCCFWDYCSWFCSWLWFLLLFRFWLVKDKNVQRIIQRVGNNRNTIFYGVTSRMIEC